jgi:hypothetical protein
MLHPLISKSSAFFFSVCFLCMTLFINSHVDAKYIKHKYKYKQISSMLSNHPPREEKRNNPLQQNFLITAFSYPIDC